jgi:hypothetical protein
MLRRISPRRRLQKFGRIYKSLEQLAELLPQRLLEILDQVQDGSFDIHLHHRGLEPSVNRLVMGMLTSALFLGFHVADEQQSATLVVQGHALVPGPVPHFALGPDRLYGQHFDGAARPEGHFQVRPARPAGLSLADAKLLHVAGSGRNA